MSVNIKQIIENTIKQSLYHNSLSEKEKQQKIIDEQEISNVQNKKTSKSMDSDLENIKSGDITTDDIIDKINLIRSGRSLKDPNINANLDQYIKSLSNAEKTALMAFLKGISQITSGSVSGEDAIDPSEKPANVKMLKVKPD